MAKRKNLTGMTFGFLKIIDVAESRIAENGAKHVQWNCLCVCGNRRIVTSSKLNNLRSKRISCGCKNFTGEHGNKKLRDPKIASWRALIKRYRATARNKSKNISWALTEDQALLLFNKNCFYCGSIPSNSYNVYITKAGKANTKNIAYAKTAEIIFNGIDRKDSSLGYTVDNTVSCCKICNFAKNELSLEEFYKWITKLATYQGFKK